MVDPSSTTNRRKGQGTTVKPTPMSKMSQSAELAEYTASMRNFLASMEDAPSQSRTPGRNGRNSSGESESSASGSGSERENSPEFRWMDLASVRREHGSVDLGAFGSGSAISKETMPKQSSRRQRSSNLTGEDAQSHHHHHHHRGHRSGSPGEKSLNQKHAAPTGQNRPHLQMTAGPSAKKHCTE